MPRIAMATSSVAETDEEASTIRVDDLIQRGRSQGHLSLAELRNAFDQAGLTPAEGRSILRELAESGVRLANELGEASKSRPVRSAAGPTPRARSDLPSGARTASSRAHPRYAMRSSEEASNTTSAIVTVPGLRPATRMAAET